MPSSLITFRSVVDSARFILKHLSVKAYESSQYRQRILHSGLFDEAYYREHYGGDGLTGNALLHYLTTGWKQGFNPSADFSTEGYNILNEGVLGKLNCKVCPLEHYVFWGKTHSCLTIAVSDWEKQTSEYTYKKWGEWSRRQQRPCLLISHEFSSTGAPLALMNMAKVLRDMGYSPLILSPTDGGITTLLKQEGLAYDVSPDICPPSFPSSGGANYPSPSGEQEEARRASFFDSFEFVLFNTSLALRWLLILPEITTRKICWLHEGDILEIRSHVCECMPMVDHVYAVSQYTIDKMKDFVPGTEKWDILPYGLEDTRATSTSTPTPALPGGAECIHFLLPGMICERKGHLVMLDAMELLPQEVADKVRIHIVGPHVADDDPTYVRIATDRHPSLVLVGEKSHEEFLEYIDRMDAVICPSLDDPLPIVCSEAMCKSKPVVMTYNTGTAQFITDKVDGYLIPAGSPQHLADIIAYLAGNMEEARRVGERGRKVFEEHFGMETFRRNIENMTNRPRQKQRDSKAEANKKAVNDKATANDKTTANDKVAIIVPVYNTASLLDRCMQSLVTQTHRNLEIVIVDDGSTDGTGRLCDEWQERDERITVVHQKNQGQSVARNVGLALCTAEYIGFCDSDDYMAADAIEAMLRPFTPAIGVVSGLVEVVMPDGQVLPLKDEWNISEEREIESEDVFQLMFDGKLNHTIYNKLYRRGVIQDLLFPAKRWCEDQYFCILAAKELEQKGLLLKEIPNVVYYYPPNPNGTTSLHRSTMLADWQKNKWETALLCLENGSLSKSRWRKAARTAWKEFKLVQAVLSSEDNMYYSPKVYSDLQAYIRRIPLSLAWRLWSLTPKFINFVFFKLHLSSNHYQIVFTDKHKQRHSHTQASGSGTINTSLANDPIQ